MQILVPEPVKEVYIGNGNLKYIARQINPKRYLDQIQFAEPRFLPDPGLRKKIFLQSIYGDSLKFLSFFRRVEIETLFY